MPTNIFDNSKQFCVSKKRLIPTTPTDPHLAWFIVEIDDLNLCNDKATCNAALMNII